MKAPTILRKEPSSASPLERAGREPKERHLRIASEHVPPRRPRTAWRRTLVSTIAVIAMLAVGTGVYTWQHAEVQNQQASAAAAIAARSALEAQVSREQARVMDLNARITEVQEQLTDARTRAAGLRQRTGDQRDQLQASAAAAAAVQTQLEKLAGPPIADGRFLAFIKAVGANQTPPVVVIDTAQWFEGRAADRAAHLDGIIPPGTHMPNDYYIRNASPAWRTLQVGPEPRISMLTWHNGALGWQRVTLGRLATAFTTPSVRDVGTNLAPFWVRIEGGSVIGIHQQYTP